MKGEFVMANVETDKVVPPSADGDIGKNRLSLLKALGPGLITGASDDDPSGIGTYSQAGAQLGFGISWTMLFSYPLMVAIQEISARLAEPPGAVSAGTSAVIIRSRWCKALSGCC
jgi:Mn2+/Fe2+ NRAMP family transporter